MQRSVIVKCMIHSILLRTAATPKTDMMDIGSASGSGSKGMCGLDYWTGHDLTTNSEAYLGESRSDYIDIDIDSGTDSALY